MSYCDVRARKVLPMFIFILAGAFYFVCRHAYYVGFFNDDAFYIIGARSLLHGRFLELNQPGHPPLVEYLPGFPFLLAPWVWLFPAATQPYQIFSLLMALLSLAIFWSFLKDTASFPIAVIALAIAGLNPLMVSLSAQVLSDIPYLLFSLAALEVGRRMWDSKDRRSWFFLAVLTCASYCIRPVGMAIGISFCAALGIERRWRELAYFSLFLALLAAPFATQQTLRKLNEVGTTYGNQYFDRDALRGFVENGNYYLNEIFIRNLFRWPLNLKFLNFTTLLFCSLSTGFGFCWFKMDGWKKVLPLYLILYSAVHIVWSKQSGRYVYPIFPFAVFFFLNGMDHIRRNLKIRSLLIYGMAALIVFCYVGPLAKILQASLTLHTPLNSPPERTYQWVRANTKISDIFVTELDGRFFLYTGRQVFHLPKIFEADRLSAWILERKINFILLDRAPAVMKTRRGNTPNDPYPFQRLEQIVRNERVFEEVFRDDGEGLALYRVVQNKPNP